MTTPANDAHLRSIRNFAVGVILCFASLSCVVYVIDWLTISMPVDFLEQHWRNPDLEEVIEYLTHTSDVIKENAAAYLQHLCYNDDNIKSKTRSLNGISYLVALLNHEKVEIQKNACGALRNLCYGKRNDENKVRRERSTLCRLS
jgi:alkylhydroperoxidase/carboxymuconolactone decarboxylase family protein YurZ